MTKKEFIKQYKSAMKQGYKYIGVEVIVEGNIDPEYIINKASNFNSKLEYYKKAYNDDMQLIANKFLPQEARMVLPNATKTELIMTAYNDDWQEIFNLRCSDSADEEIRFLCNPLKDQIK